MSNQIDLLMEQNFSSLSDRWTKTEENLSSPLASSFVPANRNQRHNERVFCSGQLRMIISVEIWMEEQSDASQTNTLTMTMAEGGREREKKKKKKKNRRGRKIICLNNLSSSFFVRLIISMEKNSSFQENNKEQTYH